MQNDGFYLYSLEWTSYNRLKRKLSSPNIMYNSDGDNLCMGIQWCEKLFFYQWIGCNLIKISSTNKKQYACS